MEKRKKIQAKIIKASNEKIIFQLDQIIKAPKIGDSLVVTITSKAKVEMINPSSNEPKVRDTIARGKIIDVTGSILTIKPMCSRTNFSKLQNLASSKTDVGLFAIENQIKAYY